MMTSTENEPLRPVEQDSAAKTIKVLCIDDDLNFLGGLRRRFRRHGIQMLWAAFGRHGYQLAIDKQPAVIVCDLCMPDGSGYWLLDKLRSDALTRDIPVLLLSGHIDRPVEKVAIQLGAQRVLAKPIPFRQLLDELQPYLPLA